MRLEPVKPRVKPQLSYDGKTAVVAVPQEEAAKFRPDFAEGRAVLASPGEAT